MSAFFDYLNGNGGASVFAMFDYIKADNRFSWELDPVYVTGTRSSFRNGDWLGDFWTRLSDAQAQLDNIKSISTAHFGLERTKLALDIGGGLYSAFETAVASGDQWLGKNGKYYNRSRGGNQYTGSRSGAYRAAGMYKWAGRSAAVASVLVGGLETYRGYQIDGGTFGYNAQKAAASSLGGIAGGIGGAALGAEIGAGIGIWFGGVGAIPGAIIGGFVGGVIGGRMGSGLGENSIDWYYGR